MGHQIQSRWMSAARDTIQSMFRLLMLSGNMVGIYPQRTHPLLGCITPGLWAGKTNRQILKESGSSPSTPPLGQLLRDASESLSTGKLNACAHLTIFPCTETISSLFLLVMPWKHQQLCICCLCFESFMSQLQICAESLNKRWKHGGRNTTWKMQEKLNKVEK